MRVYALQFELALYGESFIRSIHLTERGAIIEQCNYLIELLLDMDYKQEDIKEINYLSKIIEKDDNITLGQLVEHSKVLQFYANNVEIYTEIEWRTLQP